VTRPLSLAQQNAWRLVILFVVFELLTAAAVVSLLMLPMARRASGDLAGLMVLSAQTWNELPPETRPAFIHELKRSHQLALSPEKPNGRAGEMVWHTPYMHYMEQSLVQRTGRNIKLINIENEGETWHWAALPSSAGHLWVGFPHGRTGPRPVAAAAVTLLVGLILALLAARWLAHRTVAPLKQLDAAATLLGQGGSPGLLPERGPRELAALTHRFNELARQVQDLLEARTTLLAGLSHDLRTPLARMRLALEMLQRRPEKTWIDRLDTDICEMDRLVGELLELARGLGREASAPVDLVTLLEELADQVRQTGAAVKVIAQPITLHTPPAALRRSLGNLLGNARRYGVKGIELRAELAGDSCRIGVLDRGPGIPEDQLEAVFHPFHRVESSRNPTTGGAGLGLAIVRQLAQANGWTIELENRPEGGLAAWLTMPVSSHT
jgi:two-component system osmolarity sensor histidine kinase EnvZ